MRLRTFAVAAAGALALAAPAAAVESPPSGITPHVFATQYSGCLGQLRSKIAQGDFAGIGPFGQHFTGLVNPGAHQGTVGEEEFLRVVIGIPESELAAFRPILRVNGATGPPCGHGLSVVSDWRRNRGPPGAGSEALALRFQLSTTEGASRNP